MEVDIKAKSRFEIGDTVTVKFASSEFGEWDIERNLKVTRVSFYDTTFYYDVKQINGFNSWTLIPEYQVSRG